MLNLLCDDLFKKRYSRNIEYAANWIKMSIKHTGGSSAFYLPIGPAFGVWAPPYPETSGYLIPTLIQYADFASKPYYRLIAYKMANWLCKIQTSSGAFTSGPLIKRRRLKLSVFNTAQIMFGLLSAFEYFKEKRFLVAVEKAAKWICSVQEPDGRWVKYAYVNGYFPSYYSYVIWPLLRFWEKTKWAPARKASEKGISHILERIYSNLWISDMGFQPGKPAFTHTIAYTIQGLLESSMILNDKRLIKATQELSEKLLHLVETKGLHGAYTEEWKPVWKGVCVTGHCQIALIFLRICEQTKDRRYLNAALKLIDIAANTQVLHSIDRNRLGALPGSMPFWGRYMRFRYPNWTAKFFLDALIQIQSLKETQNERSH